LKDNISRLRAQVWNIIREERVSHDADTPQLRTLEESNAEKDDFTTNDD
jgi:hypothetical protein